MKKICVLLLTAFLFAVNIFAGNIKKNETTVLDAIGPVITYTLLGNSSCVSSRTFTADITDVDGVNTVSGTRPRVYYRRSTDANAWVDNTTATNGWKYAEATNTTTPFNFVIDYSLLYMGTGVSTGQTIQYFIVAQDLNVTPNISINSGSFAAPPSSVALTAAAFPIGCCSNIYGIVNALPTSLTIGAAGYFTSLTSAAGLFSSINTSGLSGNTTVEIIDPVVTENNTFPLSQIVNTGCGLGTVTLTIKPAAGINAVVTGSRANEPIVRILSSNVTIDGSNNGTTSRNLTLQNTSSLGLVILYGSSGTTPTTNSTLKNTICISTINTTSAVVVADGSGAAGPGYFNNISIQNNSIQKSQIGVICVASPVTGNGSVLITGNDLNSTGTNQVGLLGIYAEGVDGAVITNNNIGNFETSLTAPRYGIQLFTNTINSTVSGNNISGISYSGSSTALTYGIYVAPGVIASNNNITGNTISNISSTGTGAVYGLQMIGASGGITIQKNNISNIKNTNGGGFGAFGIGLSSGLTAANITVANNFIYDVAGFGVATLIRNGYGLFLSSGGGYKLYYNSINMSANQTNPSGVSAALLITSTVTTAASLDVRNNIFANTQTGGTSAASRYTIYSGNPGNTIFSNIDNNDYYTATGTNLGFIGGNRIALTDIQTGFGANTNSVNVQPVFVSSTDLHLTNANCGLDNRGVPVTITTDIDAATRDITTPDIGADEFTSINSGTLAGVAPTVICDSKTVSPAGTIYVSSTCDLIARVLPAGASPVAGKINACVTLNTTQLYFNGEPFVKRHYDIEPVTNAATATATVTLYFTDAEFVNYNIINSATWPLLPTNGAGNTVANKNNIRITQFHGAATMSPSTPGNYPGVAVLINPGAGNVLWNGTYWEVTIPVTGFSGFYLHTTQFNLPLPVTINYFNGQRQGNNHLLDWKVTCNTSPRVTMVLERSADSRNFNPINTVTADAVRCNQPFDYTDTDPLKGMNYYRLKITDADGKVSYSSIVALLNAVKGFDIISIAPNPVVNDNFKLNVSSAQSGKMEMLIFDMQGRLVNKQTLSLIAGFNSLPVNVAGLSAGTYTIKGSMSDDQPKMMRFVKQ